jgi:transcriptional regulator with XRE-family HTH domain
MATRDSQRLARRVRELREEGGLSQMDMVRRHGWTLSHWQKIERGVLDPRMSTLLRIAKSLGVSASELFKGL